MVVAFIVGLKLLLNSNFAICTACQFIVVLTERLGKELAYNTPRREEPGLAVMMRELDWPRVRAVHSQGNVGL